MGATTQKKYKVRTSITSVFMVLAVGLFWGLNWPAVKFIMSELPPFTIRAVAFPLATVLLVIVTLIQGHSLRPARSERLPLLMTSFFLIFGFNILTSLGQSLTEASNAAIIAYTMPAMTAVLSVICLKDSVGWRLVIALALGMAGIVVLAAKDFVAFLDNPAGPLVMLLAALSWSVGNISIKAHQWQLAPAALAAWLFAIAIVPTWPLVWLTESPTASGWPSTAVTMAMLFHIVGPMVICYLLWALLVRRLPVAVAAISVLTAPVVAVLSAVIFLGEELSLYKVLSVSLILVSIFITQRA